MIRNREIEVKLAAEDASREYGVVIGSGVLDSVGRRLNETVGGERTVVVISDSRVFRIYGDRVLRSLREEGFRDFSYSLRPGEDRKNLHSAGSILDKLGEWKIGRDDVVVALGGGVVGDIAGFAASIHMRGIRLFQVPTTLLSMIDSSVGGKTGVNSAHGKNLIGTFHQPCGVLIDVETLQTLDPREISAGLYEAVKQAALQGREALELISRFLDGSGADAFREDPWSSGFAEELCGIVETQVRFKAAVVSGDPLEAIGREDPSSRKILNFGHTVGHALEKITDFRHFLHGEAVAYGILAAAEISKRLEISDIDDINLLNDVVRSVGQLPDASQIDVAEILTAIESDKKSSGGTVRWVLLKGLGEPVIVPSTDIPTNLIEESIKSAISPR